METTQNKAIELYVGPTPNGQKVDVGVIQGRQRHILVIVLTNRNRVVGSCIGDERFLKLSQMRKERPYGFFFVKYRDNKADKGHYNAPPQLLPCPAVQL